MLNFTTTKVLTIYLIFVFISFFSLLNFNKIEYLDKRVNLGLDLQGGSYLLLEIDTDPLIKEKIQGKVIPLKKFLKENNFEYQNFKINEKSLFFSIKENELDKFKLLFFKKNENDLNQFLNQYNKHELDFNTIDKSIEVFFSKYGILTINNSALKQSIEIVRRRIDDVGTKEPTILQRGEKRILVELPGLKDPDRIKNLLGKTAQLNFRLISQSNSEFGSEKMLSEDGQELFVSKRIVMSGENLIDAQPRLDSQANEPIVYFSLDRLGAQKFGKTTLENVGKRLAIVLDNSIISAPSIREPITSGSGTISGNFTFQ